MRTITTISTSTDGPQMVNNNSGLGVGMDDAEEEPVEGAQKKNKVVNIHATTQLKVVLVKPERFEDASTIADPPEQQAHGTC